MSSGSTLTLMLHCSGGTRVRALFFTVVWLCGIGTGVIENFLFLFLQNDLHGPKTLLGLSRFITCAAEIPMFWYAGTLTKRFGTFGVLAFACVCYFIRFVSYANLYNPWLVCLVEPLHGVTYAVMWNASTSYASDIAPSGLGSTTQGLLASVHWGFGMGSGMSISDSFE
eukprot:m.247627 g.247627  ORF g.247627 m.247627 type:complete len:169 (+) comp19499_c0_seq2:1251-1757(+)